MNSKRLQIDDSLPYLLKGIGLTIVVLGTFIGIVYARIDSAQQNRPPAANSTAGLQSAAPGSEQSLAALSREVARLRLKLDEETTVEEMLVNPWFEAFSLLGSAVFASSFFLEWKIKRLREPERINARSEKVDRGV